MPRASWSSRYSGSSALRRKSNATASRSRDRARRVAPSGYLQVARTLGTYILVDPRPIQGNEKRGRCPHPLEAESDQIRALERYSPRSRNLWFGRNGSVPLLMEGGAPPQGKSDSSWPWEWSATGLGRRWFPGGVGESSSGTWVSLRWARRSLGSGRDQPGDDGPGQTTRGLPMKAPICLIPALLFAHSPTLGCPSNPAPTPNAAPIPATAEPERPWFSSSTPWTVEGVPLVGVTTLALAPLKQCRLREGECRMVSVALGTEPVYPGECDLTKSDPEDYPWVDCSGCNGRGRTCVLGAWLGNRGSRSRKYPIVRQEEEGHSPASPPLGHR